MSDTKTPDQVDVRGPRFAAWITTAVLVIALLVSGVSPFAAAEILGVQSVVFAIGALAGPRRHPVGLIFAAPAAIGFANGAVLFGVVLTGAALVAAFLNAAFGICLGCQLYPLVARLKPAHGTS
jgi:hypothetical protein